MGDQVWRGHRNVDGFHNFFLSPQIIMLSFLISDFVRKLSQAKTDSDQEAQKENWVKNEGLGGSHTGDEKPSCRRSRGLKEAEWTVL